MGTKIRTDREVIVTVPDEIGILSRISTAISETNINIRAMCAYKMDNTAHLRLITDDNERAIDVLKKAGFEATEKGVIMAEVSPHVMHPEITSMAGDYDVEDNYWCASAHGGDHALLVFSPTDNLQGATLK